MSIGSTLAACTLAAIAGAAVVTWAVPAGEPNRLTAEAVTYPEPPPTSRFLAAYARGDEAAAERLASPLYAAEWARRGLSVDDRRGLLPEWSRQEAGAAWLRFSYVGGVTGPGGFLHLLYTAGSARLTHDPDPSVWRLDADPKGRVIWAELVWRSVADAEPVSPADLTGGLQDVPIPAELIGLRPRVVLGVRSRVGSGGYFAISVDPDAADDAVCDCRGRIVFYAVDDSGAIRPGAWSFGTAATGPSEYGERAPSPVRRPTIESTGLLSAYLRTLS